MSRLSRTAVDGSLRIVRLPLDLAITLLPAGRRSARLAIDRMDANARALAASILGDERLREDANRRHEAAHARQKGDDLRGRAGQVAEQADERVAERHRDAARRRRTADERAGSRRNAAEERQQRRTQQAARAERQQLEASRQSEAAVEQAIAEEAPRARVEALDEVDETQQERASALAEADEAERLHEAAERVKEQRKQT